MGNLGCADSKYIRESATFWHSDVYVGFSAIIENGPVTQKSQIIEACFFSI